MINGPQQCPIPSVSSYPLFWQLDWRINNSVTEEEYRNLSIVSPFPFSSQSLPTSLPFISILLTLLFPFSSNPRIFHQPVLYVTITWMAQSHVSHLLYHLIILTECLEDNQRWYWKISKSYHNSSLFTPLSLPSYFPPLSLFSFHSSIPRIFPQAMWSAIFIWWMVHSNVLPSLVSPNYLDRVPGG